MLIELTYDLALELAFLVFGRYPIDSMNQIAAKKLAIYNKLGDETSSVTTWAVPT